MKVKITGIQLKIICWVRSVGAGLSRICSHIVKPMMMGQMPMARSPPMTGIVLRTTNPAVKTAPTQLEYSYLAYDRVVREKGKYDWSAVEQLLDEVAGRKHQLVLRWHDT